MLLPFTKLLLIYVSRKDLASNQLLSTAYCLGGGSSCSEDGAGQDRHGHAKAQGKEQLESACELQN